MAQDENVHKIAKEASQSLDVPDISKTRSKLFDAGEALYSDIEDDQSKQVSRGKGLLTDTGGAAKLPNGDLGSRNSANSSSATSDSSSKGANSRLNTSGQSEGASAESVVSKGAVLNSASSAEAERVSSKPHPTPGSSDRQTPPHPTDRSVQGSNPESKPISVERQQGTEAKSVGYPAEQGKSNPNASVEPNRPFMAGDEVLAKRAQGMSVQNPETNQHQNRPTGLDSGNFKTGGPNNRADSGAGKAESEPQRHDTAESLPTRLEKPDYRTATAPIGLRGEELLDYGLRRPTATTASGTIDSKAEPQHKQQQPFPNSDLKVAGSDNPVKRTDPSEKGHFVSDAGGKSVGGDKQSTESDTRVPLPGKGGVAGVIAGGIESIKEGFRFVRDSLVGSITDRSGTGKGMRTEVFLGFAGLVCCDRCF